MAYCIYKKLKKQITLDGENWVDSCTPEYTKGELIRCGLDSPLYHESYKDYTIRGNFSYKCANFNSEVIVTPEKIELANTTKFDLVVRYRNKDNKYIELTKVLNFAIGETITEYLDFDCKEVLLNDRGQPDDFEMVIRHNNGVAHVDARELDPMYSYMEELVTIPKLPPFTNLAILGNVSAGYYYGFFSKVKQQVINNIDISNIKSIYNFVYTATSTDYDSADYSRWVINPNIVQTTGFGVQGFIETSAKNFKTPTYYCSGIPFDTIFYPNEYVQNYDFSPINLINAGDEVNLSGMVNLGDRFNHKYSDYTIILPRNLKYEHFYSKYNKKYNSFIGGTSDSYSTIHISVKCDAQSYELFKVHPETLLSSFKTFSDIENSGFLSLEVIDYD